MPSIMKISEMIEKLQEYVNDYGDNDIWFCRDGEWIGLIKSDIEYCEGDEGEEPGLYIGI